MEQHLTDIHKLIPFQNDGSVIQSSTISLSRNLTGYKFVPKASNTELQEILDEVCDCISEELNNDYTFNEPDFQDPFLGDLLVENQTTSVNFEQKNCPRGTLISDGTQTAIVINDLDHIKIQTRRNFLQTKECWLEADGVDDLIESKVHYAFSPQFGYLTTSLENAGTGLRVSIAMHLPALAMHGKIGDLYDFAEAKDLDISGCRGDCDPEGDLFCISNNITIGKSEEEIITYVNKIVTRIAQFELQTRKLLVCEQYDNLSDSVNRALGTLKYARMINYIEAANLISKVKLGAMTGILKGIEPETIEKLLKMIKPAQLNYDNCEVLEYNKEESIRADMIRSALSSF
ncbi:MAG: hypothetical protein ACIAQZ_10470 [Sedimentisphaeraceae bacterium JB056]